MPTPPALSALQVPVPAAESALRAVRELDDDTIRLLAPAHVSLAYPWLPPEEALARLPALAEVLARQAPFPLRFGAVDTFPVRGGRQVVHLRPADPGPLRALAALLDGDPEATPHLSLARITDDGRRAAAVRAAVRPLLPIETVVGAVEVRVRPEDGRWRVAETLVLGDGPRLPGVGGLAGGDPGEDGADGSD